MAGGLAMNMPDNPWNDIPLDVYEAHMRSDGVGQLQALNAITATQLRLGMRRVTILGAAGGNGLEHVDPRVTDKVWAVDINGEYLDTCRTRFAHLGDVLETVCCDLTAPDAALPDADLLICNLVIEYLGAERFAALVRRHGRPFRLVSCAIQQNLGHSFVSSSALARRLERLESVHQDVGEAELVSAMASAGYEAALREAYPLPNGKQLVRIDFMPMQG